MNFHFHMEAFCGTVFQRQFPSHVMIGRKAASIGTRSEKM